MSHPSIASIRPDWLARRREEPIDPGRPIVDTHHHVMDFPGLRYLEDAFLADIAESGHNVVATVHVDARRGYRETGPEALRPVGETESLLAVARSLPPEAPRLALGMVGFADLSLGTGVGEVLDAHIAAGQGRFKGVRNISPWDPDPSLTPEFLHGRPRLLLDPVFRQGFAELGRRDLSFDSWIYSPQIPELVDLADAFPDVTIILDHCGTPVMQGRYAADRAQSFRDWADAIATLAHRPNVVCKLGGLAKWLTALAFHDRPEPPGSEQLAAAWRPYVDHCIDRFGADRCMFESNFPMEKPSCSYGMFWNACKRIAAPLSADEKHALFAGTACRAYRMTLQASKGS
jgi:predicted TIM-barrel fold metal-dependent hydrolase